MINAIKLGAQHANGFLASAWHGIGCLAIALLALFPPTASAQVVTEYRFAPPLTTADNWGAWTQIAGWAGACTAAAARTVALYTVYQSAIANVAIFDCRAEVLISQPGNIPYVSRPNVRQQTRTRSLGPCENKTDGPAIPANAIVNTSGTGFTTFVPVATLPSLSSQIPMCVDSCEATGLPDVCGTAIKDGVRSHHCYIDNPKFTGNSCTPSPLTTPQVAPPTGKDGAQSCPAEFNGVKMWFPCAETTQYRPPSTTTVATPAGTRTVSNPDQRTTCDGQNCTTTVPPLPNGSGGTSPTTQVQPQDTFCNLNPSSPQCKMSENTTFGGSCNAGFNCTGDAAVCATARGVWETSCNLGSLKVDSGNTQVALGNSSMTGQDPSDHPRLNKLSINPGTFDTSNPFSQQCPADTTISAAGASISLPLSALCSPLQWLGYLAIAFTLLAAARIVVEGV